MYSCSISDENVDDGDSPTATWSVKVTGDDLHFVVGDALEAARIQRRDELLAEVIVYIFGGGDPFSTVWPGHAEAIKNLTDAAAAIVDGYELLGRSLREGKPRHELDHT